MKYFLTLVLVATTLFAYSQTKDRPEGKIKGTVTDKSGNPVAAATVFVVPQDITFDSVTPRSSKTDSNGEFDFHGSFQLGTYKLYARKDAEAYPDSSDSFYADPKAEAPKVELTEDHPTATVTVALGEKAGVLVGKVVDADTHLPLEAKLIFLDEDGHDHSIFVTGKYRALLPAGKDITLMVVVMSPDYRAQLPTAPLRLEAGQEMQMDIPLAKQ